MLARGIIEKSASSYSSPIVIVPKKDGTRRMCIDFKRLNAQTTKDNYPMPTIEENLNRMSGARVFSSLDLLAGYWQVPLRNCDRHKTAFQHDGELYQFTVMPFGLCNGPATFQRLMNTVLEECREFATAYLDDVIIFSQDVRSHLGDLQRVFDAIARAQVKIKPTKCRFLAQSIRYLGYIISAKGIEPVTERIDAISQFVSPTSTREVKRFLGTASFYRRHIPNFADIAAPLDHISSKRAIFTWSEECEKAFQCLKTAISSAPVLRLPDFTVPFSLHVDASGVALGAVLSQAFGDSFHPVAFGSRKLTQCEQRYATVDREALALSWACKYFEHYLCGAHFHVYSDHRPLLGLLSAKTVTPRQFRILNSLCRFNFSLHYIKGRLNVVADLFSRPLTGLDAATTPITAGTPSCSQMPGSVFPAIGAVADSALAQCVAQAQAADLFSSQCCALLRGENSPPHDSPDLRFFRKNKECFALNSDGHLYFKGTLVVPQSVQEKVLSTFHEGHFDRFRMLFLMRKRYWWYRQPSAAQRFVQRCQICAQSKAGGAIRCSQGTLPSPGPYELVFVDIVGPLPRFDGYQYLLTMEDAFTRFTRAIPIRHISTSCVLDAFYRHWISTFHAPVRIHSDNGTQFTSQKFHEMCDALGIEYSTSSPYHPEGNSRIERFHRTLKDRLRCCANPAAWPNNIFSMTLAYNSSVHSATGYSPFELAFGFQPRPPGDWPTTYSRGNSPLTSDLKMMWNSCTTTEGAHGTSRKQLHEGDSVLVRVPGASGLDRPWSPPKKLLRITGPTSGQVEDFGRVHFSRLKFFCKGGGM
jgi:hypothetical protein